MKSNRILKEINEELKKIIEELKDCLKNERDRNIIKWTIIAGYSIIFILVVYAQFKL